MTTAINDEIVSVLGCKYLDTWLSAIYISDYIYIG